MNYMKNLRKISRLARRVGMPLKSIDFKDGGVQFTFVVENDVPMSFPEADEGVDKVVHWLEEMLPKEFREPKENTVFPDE